MLMKESPNILGTMLPWDLKLVSKKDSENLKSIPTQPDQSSLYGFAYICRLNQ